MQVRMTESKVQHRCIEMAKRVGWLVIRQHKGSGAATGWPDVAFVTKYGRTVWIEFKRPGGKVSQVQRRRIDQLKENKASVYVVDDVMTMSAIILANRY